MRFGPLCAVKLHDHNRRVRGLGFELKLCPVVSGASSLGLSGRVTR